MQKLKYDWISCIEQCFLRTCYVMVCYTYIKKSSSKSKFKSKYLWKKLERNSHPLSWLLLILLKFDQTLTLWIVTGVTLSHLKELKFGIILEIVNKIHENLFSPGCPSHSSSANENKDKSKFIVVSQCGKFYHVRYEFQYEKGGTTIKVLPAMCEKMTLRSICLYF